MTVNPIYPSHDCGSYDTPVPLFGRDPRTMVGHCRKCGLPISSDASDEPRRNPDSRDSTPPLWLKRTMLAILIPAFIAAMWAAYTVDDTPRQKAVREQHEIQLKACLGAGGVPYFLGNGLFWQCQFNPGVTK